MVTVHHALEAAALGHAGHFHDVTRLEDRHAERLPRLRRCSRGTFRRRREGEALQHARHDLETRPLHVSEQRLGRTLRLLRAETELDRGPPFPIRDLHDGARPGLDHGHRHVRALLIEEPRHAELASDECVHVLLGYSTLISTSTPAGRSSFVNASTVCGRESRMSISRLCVFSSNCSRLFLSMCGLRSTVHSDRLVGSGIGPDTCAPVFSAVRTISAAAWSMSAWSKALSRMRILPAMGAPYFLILVTTPAPTVRPPSRIANRSPSSIAIGVINSIVIFVLSPGITISTPLANSTVPVTSVVRR